MGSRSNLTAAYARLDKLSVLTILHEYKLNKQMTDSSWKKNQLRFSDVFRKPLDDELLLFEMFSGKVTSL